MVPYTLLRELLFYLYFSREVLLRPMLAMDCLKSLVQSKAVGIRLEIRGGQWKEAYMQMDGEPWKQPLSNRYSSFMEIMREPVQSVLVKGE